MRTQWDWSWARAFLAAAEAGSLSGAARRLGLSQPTLGRHIADLEAALETPLFDRTARGLRLTAAGAAMVERARVMAAEAEAMSRMARDASDAIAGTVRISASKIIATYVLPPLMAVLRAEAPRLHLELVASDDVDNLVEHEADIAVRMTRPVQKSLVARHLGDAPVSAYVAESYVARRGAPATLDDLRAHALVGYDRSDILVRGLAASGLDLTREDFGFRCDDAAAAWEAAKAGAGVAFVLTVVGDATPGMRRVLPDAGAHLPVWLTAHRDVRTVARVRHVFDQLAMGLRAALRAPR